jgi:hypothetical protein
MECPGGGPTPWRGVPRPRCWPWEATQPRRGPGGGPTPWRGVPRPRCWPWEATQPRRGPGGGPTPWRGVPRPRCWPWEATQPRRGPALGGCPRCALGRDCGRLVLGILPITADSAQKTDYVHFLFPTAILKPISHLGCCCVRLSLQQPPPAKPLCLVPINPRCACWRSEDLADPSP